MKEILIFGDSIAAGSDLPEGGSARAWPALVEEMGAGAIACRNASQGGRATNSVAEFVAALGKNAGAHLVTIALGTNDSRDLSSKCVDRAVENLERMIRHARKMGTARVLIVAPCNLRLDALKTSHAIGPQREKQIKLLAAAFRSLAEREKIGFVDTFGVVPPECLARDGVHPDGEGERQLAEFLFPLIRAELSQA